MEIIKKYLGYIIVAAGLIGFIIFNNASSPEETKTNIVHLNDEIDTTSIQEKTIIVNIKGEVNFPGMYEITDNLRVGDLLAIAGGATEDADLTNTNLADKLSDSMEIIIPKKQSSKVIITTKNNNNTITVEIKGEVKNPGIYTLSANSRIDDLLEIAGGLSTLADTQTIELARILNDGDSITIPKKEDSQEKVNMIYVKITGEVVNPDVYYVEDTLTMKELVNLAGGVTANADINSINWDTELCLGAIIYIPSFSDEQNYYSEYDNNGLININYASVETLIQLPGIGDILAQRIVDYRSENGNFLTVEDIMNVSGIKTSVYEQIQELITV